MNSNINWELLSCFLSKDTSQVKFSQRSYDLITFPDEPNCGKNAVLCNVEECIKIPISGMRRELGPTSKI